jgi:hypothetical protein
MAESAKIAILQVIIDHQQRRSFNASAHVSGHSFTFTGLLHPEERADLGRLFKKLRSGCKVNSRMPSSEGGQLASHGNAKGLSHKARTKVSTRARSVIYTDRRFLFQGGSK